ncbi:asparagine synthase (glutamine-hydrolyzing) [Scleromatobacter humisilvae]|uniref:asparagine synthase (glutamine-hydrolyzing) n=1 Tax=Scleromatobacter humisilvae TaxID=2897159 RepID=A0A9X1YKR1_9BURK|nr:asparagine synthase (glutamine-hydrolyzing) [Scleromatobacter humisilvae]MCK9688359.1 asparagine synthase (glutamine-hydrolyzing) [Scleromatobacter humisilvae]
MCGIAGLWQLDCQLGDDQGRARVKAMTDAISYRGPDGEGLWSAPERGIYLGHRRLAIVDLSPAGAQPMASAGGRYVTVFNGEIYNHVELRKALDAEAPPAWRGHSDTETMLYGFERWGIPATLERAVGMFALAVWDREGDCLWLARDRLGEKPLYVTQRGQAVAWASELGALRAGGMLRGDIDPEALASLLQHGYVAEGRSIEAGVSQLPPGHWLRIARDGTRTQQAYWRPFEAAEGPALGDAEALDELERLLRQSIGLQLMADVPVGAFLSGGVDSSLIAALGQKLCDGGLTTFTIGFDEAAYNEAPQAAAVARHLGTRHREVTVRGADALALVPRLSTMYGEPFADPSALPTALLMRAARQEVTVALSGDAGDELFGGYGRYLQYPSTYAATRRVPASLRRRLPGWLGDNGLVDAVGRTVGRPQLGDRVHKGLPLLASRDFPEFAQGFAALWRDPAELMRTPAPRRPRGYGALPGATDALQQAEAMSRHDLTGYLPDDILVKVDRAAMAASLETRTPLLDHRIVDFAFRRPMQQKIRAGRGKWLLRELLQRHVPLALVDRPKQGFSAPIGPWLRGELREWAGDLLQTSLLQRQGLLHAEPVQRCWNEHLAGHRDWSRRLWPVLMLQQWLADRDASRARPEPGAPTS